MYELECNVQEQSSGKQAEWCGWSCMWRRQSWIGCAGELEASDNVWAKQMSWSTDGWCPMRLPGPRHSVHAANEWRFSSLRRPNRSWRNQAALQREHRRRFSPCPQWGRANVTHSLDMIESRLRDWVDMVVKSQMFVQCYPQYFDVICQWNRWAGDVNWGKARITSRALSSPKNDCIRFIYKASHMEVNGTVQHTWP